MPSSARTARSICATTRTRANCLERVVRRRRADARANRASGSRRSRERILARRARRCPRLRSALPRSRSRDRLLRGRRPPLPRAAVERIVALMQAEGMTAKVSSIHVNGWFGSVRQARDDATAVRRGVRRLISSASASAVRVRRRLAERRADVRVLPECRRRRQRAREFADRLAALARVCHAGGIGRGLRRGSRHSCSTAPWPSDASRSQHPLRRDRRGLVARGKEQRAVLMTTLLRLVVRIPHLDVGNRTRNTPCAAVGTHFREACGLPVFQIPGPPVRFVAAAAALLIAYSCSAATMSAEDTRFAAFVRDRPRWLAGGSTPRKPLPSGTTKCTADRASIPTPRRGPRAQVRHRHAGGAGAVRPKALSVSNRVDLALVQSKLESDRWYATVFKSWQWQPSQYNVANSFARQLSTEYALVRHEAQACTGASRRRPRLLCRRQGQHRAPHARGHHAGARAEPGGARRVRRRAHAQGRRVGPFRVGQGALQGACRRGQGGDNRPCRVPRRSQGEARAWGARSFRIGRELYAQKFAYDIQSRYSVEELSRDGQGREGEPARSDGAQRRACCGPNTRGRREDADRPARADRAVIDAMSAHHATPDRFVETVRRQIPELERFVRDHDLVDQDPTRPLVVREMPAYQRGLAGAHVESRRATYDRRPAQPTTMSRRSTVTRLRRARNRSCAEVQRLDAAAPQHS